MSGKSNTPRRDLLAHVLVPVATEADARETAKALTPYEPNRVTVLHVVEKGGGVPDKTPVEQSEKLAQAAFAAFRETFPDADDQTVYSSDIVTAIVDSAAQIEASAIAYRPRTGGRLVKFLSGNLSFKLINNSDRPIIALPRGTVVDE